MRLYLPHAAIRPALLNGEEQDAAPAGLLSKPAQGAKAYHYHLAISPLDCSGCGNCVDIRPSRGKALKCSLDSQRQMAPVWDYALALTPKSNPFRRRRSKAASLKPRCWSFRRLRGLRRNALCPPDNPAVWRPDADR